MATSSQSLDRDYRTDLNSFPGDNWTSGNRIVVLENGDEIFPAMLDAIDRAEETIRFLSFSKLLNSAKKHVRTVTAYLIPDQKMIDLLRQTTSRGVEVELIVPGPQRDSWLAHSRSRLAWPDLLDCDVKIYLYQPSMCHAKMTIIDDRVTTVGSANFDQLSFHLNEEANLIVDSIEFSKLMVERFKADRNQSIRLTREQFEIRGNWSKFKEYVADKFPLPYWKNGSEY